MAQQKRERAFTLIELLIVVAIIAILAAIAVPNFLEAQARSKVSRCKADMRTLATAFESYYVDNNSYPPDFSAVLRGKTQYNQLNTRLAHLTTPISYITSIIPDPLNNIVATNGSTRPVSGSPTSSGPFRQGGTSSTAPLLQPISFDYAMFDRKVAPYDNPAIWAEVTANPDTVQWSINSAGPNGKIFDYMGFSNLTVYDPTNGTLSYGQIIRTNNSAEDRPKNL